MKAINQKMIQNEIDLYLCKHTNKTFTINKETEIDYYGHNNPLETLNGYPRILITTLTKPDFQTKEQCILITTERLTNPIHTIQTLNTIIQNIITDTITLTKTLTQILTQKTPINKQKQETLTQIIQNLTNLTKTLLKKQKTLKT